MDSPALPSFAFLIVVLVVVVDLATAWVVGLTMAENNGRIFAGAPPGLAALSGLFIVLAYYNIILPIEVSFWGSAFLAAMALWGAWADYTHLADRKKGLPKPPSRKSA